MLGTESVPLLKEKHGKLICPDLYRKPGFHMGVSRRGLPYVPGFVLTDYKSRMHPYLIAGIERLKRISDKTTEAFAERHAV